MNPTSGGEEAPQNLQQINEALRAVVEELDIVMTVGAGDAAESAARAVEDGCTHIFIAGGDGTLNEVVNGLAQLEGGLERVALGIVPQGTGNDLARGLGIPETLEGALAELTRFREARIDVCTLNDRRFVNVSAGGFIAEVSEATNPQLKTIAGKLAYLLGGAQALLDYEPVRTRVDAQDADGRPFHREFQMQLFAVGNSRMAGGGNLIAPAAVADDGLMDLCLVDAMPTLEFLGLLRRVAAGEHMDDPRVTYLQTRQVQLEFERAIKVNTDGEVLEASRCEYRVTPRQARFLIGPEPVALSRSREAA